VACPPFGSPPADPHTTRLECRRSATCFDSLFLAGPFRLCHALFFRGRGPSGAGRRLARSRAGSPPGFTACLTLESGDGDCWAEESRPRRGKKTGQLACTSHAETAGEAFLLDEPQGAGSPGPQQAAARPRAGGPHPAKGLPPAPAPATTIVPSSEFLVCSRRHPGRPPPPTRDAAIRESPSRVTPTAYRGDYELGRSRLHNEPPPGGAGPRNAPSAT